MVDWLTTFVSKINEIRTAKNVMRPFLAFFFMAGAFVLAAIKLNAPAIAWAFFAIAALAAVMLTVLGFYFARTNPRYLQSESTQLAEIKEANRQIRYLGRQDRKKDFPSVGMDVTPGPNPVGIPTVTRLPPATPSASSSESGDHA